MLDPIPYGCFVAALVFDITYARSAVILWDKAAAWLIVIGLLACAIPRLLNLLAVWAAAGRRRVGGARLDFWLNLLAIVAAIINAFVHSRDAYAVVPAAQWLSVCTVALMAMGRIVLAMRPEAAPEPRHD
jgi:uncharacterized membrane protein